MGFELMLVVLVLALVLLTLVNVYNRAGVSVVGGFCCTILILTSAWAAINYRGHAASHVPVTDRPIEVEADGYVSSTACRACHPGPYHSWHASYHRTMTQTATPESVLADFDGAEIRFHGRVFNLRTREDKLWVEMDDPNWTGPAKHAPRTESQVVLTTGSHHRQYLWIESGKGRALAQFPFTYLTAEQRWVSAAAGFLRPPATKATAPLYAGLWNKNCIHCHTTHAQPRLSNNIEEFDTQVAEFGIACEACHGPAEEHVRLNQDPKRRFSLHFGDGADPTIVQPQRLSARLSSQVCGQCHSYSSLPDVDQRRVHNLHGSVYRPGDDLLHQNFVVVDNDETRNLPVMQELRQIPNYMRNRFWSDGMVRVTGREYNALLASPCYQHGNDQAGVMSCLSCHQLHRSADDPRTTAEWANDQLYYEMDSNRPGFNANTACTQCHSQYKDDAALVEHTHHPLKSAGSSCYNCHMPHTSYGMYMAIRSHTIDSPSVAVSQQTGRPNACNLCHLDKTLGWAAQHLEQQYGIEAPELSEDEQRIAASLRWLLRGDAGQRAIIAWHMQWKPAQVAAGSNWMPPHLATLLVDPYPAVRLVAFRSLQSLPGFHELEYDFEGAPQQAEHAGWQAMEIWRRNAGATDRQAGPAVLIDKDGNLQHQQVHRLLKLRDDRPIILSE